MRRASLKRTWNGETDLSVEQQLRLATWMLSIEQSLAWHAGVCLDCLDLRRDGTGWKLRIQGRRQQGKEWTENVVAWIHCETLYDCLWLFARQVRLATVKWKADRYPVKEAT